MRGISFVPGGQREKSVFPYLFLIMFGYDKLHRSQSRRFFEDTVEISLVFKAQLVSYFLNRSQFRHQTELCFLHPFLVDIA